MSLTVGAVGLRLGGHQAGYVVGGGYADVVGVTWVFPFDADVEDTEVEVGHGCTRLKVISEGEPARQPPQTLMILMVMG